MSQSQAFAQGAIRDLLIIGATGGVLLSPFIGIWHGVSFAAGCFWIALSFFLLAWLIKLVLSPERHSRVFIFTIACAKIPASYFLLWWLYQIDELEPVTLTAGLAVLPVVLLYRGLINARTAAITEDMRKEGK